MEMFLVYVVMCFAPGISSEGCNDYAPARMFSFRSRQDCTVFAYKLLEAGRSAGEKRGLIYIDGKAFCLKFRESRET